MKLCEEGRLDAFAGVLHLEAQQHMARLRAGAMDDLGAHTLATMSGTRAALEGVLARFAPGQLEAKLAGRSVMDSLVPMNRRARLWELYLQHHQAIHEEAQEDFHQLFGRAFLAAYEQQIDRFERERAGSRAAGP